MKNKPLRLLLIGIALSFSLEAYSQGDFPIVAADSLPPVLYDYLVSSTSKHFHDPSVPRFLIKDRSYNYVFGIGGYVQALGLYDLAGMDAVSFVVSDIPVPRSNYNTDVTNMDLGLSRIFFKLIGTTPYGMINAYIETDFHGENHVLRLRQAYVEYFGFTLGQAWTTFKDSESPNTLEAQGPVSMPNRRVPLLRYTYNFTPKIKGAIGLEMTQTTDITVPNIDSDGNSAVLTIPQAIPDIPIAFEYTGEKFHAFLGYNNRFMKCPTNDGNYKNVYSMATQFSFRYHLLKTSKFTHTFYGQFIFAHGMVDCIQDMTGLGLNIVVREGAVIDVLSGWGFYAGYQMKWKKNEMNLIYSRSQPIGVAGIGDLYKFGEYAAFNYMIKVVQHGRIGAEVVYGNTALVNGKTGNDFRLNILVRYDF